MARPKKSTSEKMSETLPPVRFTETDFAQIVLRADQAKLSMSEFVRTALLKAKIVVVEGKDTFDLVQELKRSGNNLNQLTKRFNATDVEPIELRKALQAHEALLLKAIHAL